MMSTGGFSRARLGRMHDVMAGHVERGDVPGIVTLVSRHDEVHIGALGMKASGESEPMWRDTIFRIASVTKPIVAAAASHRSYRPGIWPLRKASTNSRWSLRAISE
jgi:CubicO group peptidase (beta-lactamase class C family)